MPRKPARVSAAEWERRWKRLRRFARNNRREAVRFFGNQAHEFWTGVEAEDAIILEEMSRLTRPTRRQRKER